MNFSKEDTQIVKMRSRMAMRHRDDVYTRSALKAWNMYEGEGYRQVASEGGQASRYKGIGAGSRKQSKAAATSTPPMAINYAIYIVSTKYTSIAFNEPDILVQPQTDDAQPFSAVAGLALKYYWDQCHVQEEVKLALLDRLVGGIGIVYTGWEFVSKAGEDREAYKVEGGRLPVEGEDGESTAGSGSIAPLPSKLILKDQPLILRIDPLTFFVAPECAWNLNRSPYCGYTELVPLSDIKRDPRYKKGVVRNLKGSADNLKGYMDEEDAGRDDAEQPADVRRVKVIHYYERARRVHVVLADEEGATAPLLVEKWPWEFDGYPFLQIHGVRRPSDFWPKPDLLYVEHQIREIEQARALQAQQNRMCVPKIVTKGSPLDPQQRTQLKSLVPGANIDLRQNQTVEALVIPQNTMETAATVQAAREDINAIAGLNEYDSGAPAKSHVTNEQVGALQSSQGGRVQADRQSFEYFCSHVLQRMLDLLMQFHDNPKQLPIYDQDDNVTSFEKFTGTQIRGEFKVKVHVGSLAVPNSADQLNAIMQLFTGLPQMAQAMIPLLQAGVADLRPALVAAIKLIPGIRDVDQILKPLEHQMAQSVAAQAGQIPSTMGPGGPPMVGPGGPPPMAPGAPGPGPGLPPEIVALLSELPPALLEALPHLLMQLLGGGQQPQGAPPMGGGPPGPV